MKIIWAIDAFEDNKKLNLKMLEYLTTLNTRQEAIVTPVYLHRQNSPIVYPSYESPTWFEDDTPVAENLVKSVLNDYKAPFLDPPLIINHSMQTMGSAVEKLSDYAVENNYDMIVVGTHGRSGVERYLLGSFTEALISHAEIPVVAVSPLSHKVSKIENILFATDFGENCQQSFDSVLQLCSKLATTITVFHALPKPVENIFQPGQDSSIYTAEGKLVNFSEFVELSMERKKAIVENWTQRAHSMNIDLNYIFDQTGRTVDKAILEITKTHDIDEVVMEAQSGSVSAALLGSITRKTLKSIECPLIVLPRALFDSKSFRDSKPKGTQTDLPRF